MARLPRIYVPGCSYHIVQRGNNREPCFYTEQRAGLRNVIKGAECLI